MIRYKCPKCKGNQYSASPNKSDEPCIYCRNPKVQMMDNIEESEGEDVGILHRQSLQSKESS